MDEFPRGVPALADRIRDDCVVRVTMPRLIGGVEHAGEYTPVSQSNAHGFAEIGFDLLIGHTFEIARGSPEVALLYKKCEIFRARIRAVGTKRAARARSLPRFCSQPDFLTSPRKRRT
jgi:hypothetical protein